MRRRIVLPLLIAAGLLPVASARAGSPVGPGVIMLPPIVAKYDDRCLDRIDRKDQRLAARQARECRKPRSAGTTPPPSVRAMPSPPSATPR